MGCAREAWEEGQRERTKERILNILIAITRYPEGGWPIPKVYLEELCQLNKEMMK